MNEFGRMPQPAPTLVDEKRADLVLRGVDKSFALRDGGTLEVLRGVDIEVRAGTIHALLGRSGCGKSTLLHIIAGLTPMDRGEIEIRGMPIAAFRDWRAIGYLFQDDRLLPWRTACRNVALALEPSDMPRQARRERAREMLDLVGLASFADAYPNELSGGMRSRVALARSLAPHPDILLMDEPFSRLDAQTRSALHVELARLRDLLGMTVLFVTHDVEEAAVLAEDITVLAPRPGRVVERLALPGRPPRNPLHPSIAETTRRLRLALGDVPDPIQPSGETP
jgi:NitT/TauT family transport system ATP-binding protein